MNVIKIVALAFSLSLITLTVHAESKKIFEPKLGMRAVLNDKSANNEEDVSYCQEKTRELDMALLSKNNAQIIEKSENYISHCLLMDKKKPQSLLGRLVSISSAFNEAKKYREGGMTADLCISLHDKMSGCYITRADSLINLKQKESAIDDLDSAIAIVTDTLDSYAANRDKFNTEERKKEYDLAVRFLNNKLKYIMAIQEEYEKKDK